MIHDGRVKGFPLVQYSSAEQYVESLTTFATADDAGALAWADDNHRAGFFDGTQWRWNLPGIWGSPYDLSSVNSLHFTETTEGTPRDGEIHWNNDTLEVLDGATNLMFINADLTALTSGDILTREAAHWENLHAGAELEAPASVSRHIAYRGFMPENGFENRTDSDLAMSGQNFEISPVGSFVFYTAGQRFIKESVQSVAITNNLVEHYVYFDTAGVIQVATSPFDIVSDNVSTATVYKYSSAYAIGDERHGYRRDRWWHRWAHDTIGARYESGLAGTFGDTTFSIAQGVIDDEDNEHDSGGTLTACRLWYRNPGATALYFESNVTRPWKLGATPAPQYDNAGTLTDVGANQYFCSYVYMTNDIDYPIYIVVGQAQHATVAAARNDSLPATPGMLTREWKLLYRVIYRRNGASATYTEATDFREVSTGPGSSYTPASHTSLTNRDAAGSHPASAITEGTTLGRVMQNNATTGALEASTIVKSGAGVLTLTAAGNYAVTVYAATALGQDVLTTSTVVFARVQVNASDGFKIADGGEDHHLTISVADMDDDRVLTLSIPGAYTLTIPATGAAVLRAAATVLTAGRIPFVSDGNTIADDAALVWDNVNKKLGVGVAAPETMEHVVGSLYPVMLIERKVVGVTTGTRIPLAIRTTTTADMTDGLGTGISFELKDDALTDDIIGEILALRAGADNTGAIHIRPHNAGTAINALIALPTGNVLIGTTTDGMTAAGSLAIAKDLAHRGTYAGFFNTAPITKPAVTGSRGGNAALASLLTALANLGLITDSTSA